MIENTNELNWFASGTIKLGISILCIQMSYRLSIQGQTNKQGTKEAVPQFAVVN